MARIKLNPLEKKELRETFNDNNVVEARWNGGTNKWEGITNECLPGIVNALNKRYKNYSTLSISINGKIIIKKWCI